jgi:hypothetical protein
LLNRLKDKVKDKDRVRGKGSSIRVWYVPLLPPLYEDRDGELIVDGRDVCCWTTLLGDP